MSEGQTFQMFSQIAFFVFCIGHTAVACIYATVATIIAFQMLYCKKYCMNRAVKLSSTAWRIRNMLCKFLPMIFARAHLSVHESVKYRAAGNVNHIYCAGNGYIPLEFATGFTSAHNGWLVHASRSVQSMPGMAACTCAPVHVNA